MAWLEAVGIRAKVTPAGWRHWRALAWLRGLFIPPARLRELRLIAHQRQKLVSQLARVVVKTIIAGQPPHEVLKFASRRLKASRVEIFDALQCDLTTSHHFVLDELMPHIEEIEARIARFDARLLDELKDEHNTLALLQTLPGVDLMGAAMLLVEIGTDMNAFGSAGHMASKVGICPGNHESAGKHESGRARKGNPCVRRLLCEFAHATSRTRSVVKSKFQSLVVRRGYKRAIVAIGHKILRTVFFMLKRYEHYRDSATDYEALSAQRNAPRWINALIKFDIITPAKT